MEDIIKTYASAESLKLKKRKRRRKITGRTLFYIALVLIILVSSFPFIYMILASFKTNVQVTDPSKLFIFKPYLGNYSVVFKRYDFIQPILNSLIIAVGSTLLGLFIGLPASFAIARNKMKKASIAILVVRFFPGIAFLLPWYIIFTKTGISDTHMALILSHLLINLPFIVWVMIPYFETIPKELDEAARVEGSSTLRLFITIIMPLTKPGVITTSLLAFIFSWNNFVFSLVLAGGKTKTLSLALFSFITYASIDWGALMGASVLITLPIMIMSMLTQKYIITGLTAGAVKG
jgi:multiple sugar transport system permease protein